MSKVGPAGLITAGTFVNSEPLVSACQSCGVNGASFDMRYLCPLIDADCRLQVGLLAWLMSLGTVQLALTHPSVYKVRMHACCAAQTLHNSP